MFAFWTVDCGIVTVEKSDPIRFPGQQGPHAHVVAGSSAYGPDATNDLLRGGDSCTSCDVQQDKSAYWTNQLYVAPVEALGSDETGILGMGGVRPRSIERHRNKQPPQIVRSLYRPHPPTLGSHPDEKRQRAYRLLQADHQGW